MAFKFNPFTGTFDEVGTGGGVPDPLTLNELTVNTLLTADHIHGNLAGSVYIHVKNTDTVQLDAGTPFYITGTVGASDRVEIQAADSSDPAKGPAVGLVGTTLAVNGEGNGVIIGELFNFDTDTPNWSTNDALYVANGGGLTNVKPTSGYRQIVAYVGRIQASTGTLILTGTSIDPVAGSNGQIQFNDDGGFGGDAGLTWDKSTDLLSVGGNIQLSATGSATTTDTGIYSPGADQLAISTGGTGRLFVDSSGSLTVTKAGFGGLTALFEAPNGIAEFKSTRTTGGSYSRINGTYAGNPTDYWSIGSNGYFDGSFSIWAGANNTERARIDSAGRLLVGTSSSRSISGHTGALQIDGNNFNQSTISIINNANDGNGSFLFFTKQRSGSTGGNGLVQNNDKIGEIRFTAGDGIDCDTNAARITCNVDGNPGTNDMPGRLVFSTTADGASSPTEQLRITSDRYVRLASGTGGIQFNGDTAAANALDDYEEGTWTPTYVSTGASFTYASNTNGNYVKIGRLVYCRGTIRTTSISGGTAANSVSIGGLPFTVNSNTTVESGSSGVHVFTAVSGTFAGEYPSSGLTNPNTTEASLYYRATADAATSALTYGDLAGGSNQNFIKFNLVYEV
jgi:hypothetical protein